MIHVADAELKIIMDILKARAPEGEVWAFGSRRNGTHRKHSDLDLALVGRGRQPLAVIGNLKEAFIDSTLPYRVDVLDYHAVSSSFREIIDASREVIFRSEGGSSRDDALTAEAGNR
ncbi:MAG: nucleotidyltransferase domain-containing protein [Deltaproteobacteria bacterium]|jgi:predicted nucleotidyltransferase|nr:nucleotidyltransferase domain-containing protein [Deltaproteobacteria bacterium]